ncbi:MAG: hydrogenase formation protein HypD [Bryobacterales bacterium]|nr:hydrogenase formation protein HypD [Bryobacterales bacterium]
MKHLDEYRDAASVQTLADAIHKATTQPWVLMELCGGQTHTILRCGLDSLLPAHLEIVHGPGCPVCVTALETVEKALAIASLPNVIFASYGDMLRVPGIHTDLLSLRARGADIRIVYSPQDAVRLAQANPDREVVFFAIGFETTAPAHALAVQQAHALALTNFSLLVSHVLVPPAMRAILGSPQNRVQGFIAPGHVCAITGYEPYEDLARRHHVPIVVGGFEPVDLLEAILLLVQQLESGRAEVENPYARVVSREGNRHARRATELVFETTHRKWRGIGELPDSGLCLRPQYAQFDAEQRFALAHIQADEPPECISAQVLQGLKKPTDCSAFGTRCQPESPLGAPMVSNEGACSAYYRYRRQGVESA